MNYLRGMNVYEAEIGSTYVDNNNSADVDELRFRLSILNTRTRTSTVQLVINRNLTDTSNELLAQNVNGSVDSETSTADIFLDKTARLVYNKVLRAGRFIVDLHKTVTDYQQLDQLDQVLKGAIINTVWNIQPTSELALMAQYTNTVFESVSREDEHYLYSLAYIYHARRHFTVGFDVISQERISSDSVNNYDDLRIMISFNYNTQ